MPHATGNQVRKTSAPEGWLLQMNNKTVIHLATWLFASVCLHSVSTASTPEADSVHFCLPFDYEQWRSEHPLSVSKRAVDLNVGEPRTVRLIYFLPNDRAYRAKVVQDTKDRIR